MVSRKWQQDLVHQYDMLEIVNDTFPVEKVHGCCQPIPIQRLCKFQPSRPTRHIGNGNNFFERDDLNCCHNRQDIDVSHKHSAEKGCYHYQSPYRSRDEGLFLFLVLGRFDGFHLSQKLVP